jgi:hypothetical protein
MLKRLPLAFVLACAALVAEAPSALAQQTVNFSLGYFSVRGEDARVAGDVLNANRSFLTFDVSEMSGAAAGGEWLVPIGEYLEGGAGISFTRRTIPTVYTRFTDRDGSEIAQKLRLRTVPVAFTFRVLPLGQRRGFQPYVGGGLGVINWRYSESGEFIDFRDRSVFRNSYVKSGTQTGPIALGGIRFAGDTASSGFEVRYQSASGDLDNRFAASKIDLGGWTYQFTVGMRFGR